MSKRDVIAGEELDIGAEDWNRARRGGGMTVTGPNVSRTATGFHVSTHPSINGVKWMYVVGVDETKHVVRAKQAVLIGEGDYSTDWAWQVGPTDGDIIEAPPGPMHALADFQAIAIAGEQPGPDDQTCLLIGKQYYLAQSSSSSRGWRRAKIAHIDPVNQLALVRPLRQLSGEDDIFFDPTDATDWENDADYFENLVPVWTMGLTLASPGNACVIYGDEGPGDGLSWMLPHLNLVGPDYSKSCPPEGARSPELAHQCADPPTPPPFSEAFACFLPDDVCQTHPLVDCAMMGGRVREDPDTGEYLTECP